LVPGAKAGEAKSGLTLILGSLPVGLNPLQEVQQIDDDVTAGRPMHGHVEVLVSILAKAPGRR
jgi:hypothetical protein